MYNILVAYLNNCTRKPICLASLFSSIYISQCTIKGMTKSLFYPKGCLRPIEIKLGRVNTVDRSEETEVNPVESLYRSILAASSRRSDESLS